MFSATPPSVLLTTVQTEPFCWLIDTSGRVTEISLSDTDQGPILDLNTLFVDALHPDDRHHFATQWEAIQEHPRRWSYTARLAHDDCWYDLQFIPMSQRSDATMQWMGQVIPHAFGGTDLLAAGWDQLYRDAPFGLALLDPSGVYLQINPWLARINGVSVIDHIGRTVDEIIPTIAEQIHHTLNLVMQHGEAVRDVDIIGTLPSAPGVIRIFRESWYPVRGLQQEIIAIAGIVEEVTDQRRAEKDLHVALLRSNIAEEVAHGFSFTWDVPGNQVLRSDAVTAVTGYEQSEIPLSWEGWVDLLHPEDRPKSIDDAMDFFNSFTGDTYRDTYRFLHRDGTYHWLEEQSLIVRGLNGSIDLIIGFTADVTARIVAEQQAAARLTEIEGILQALPDPLMVYDAANRMHTANEAGTRWCEAMGLFADAMALPVEERVKVYHPLTYLDGRQIPPDEFAINRLLRGEVLAGETAMDIRVRQVNGDERIARLTGSPLIRPDGAIDGAVIVIRDITNQFKQELQLREQSEQLEAIFASVADGIIFYDTQGRILKRNQALDEIFEMQRFDTDYAQLLQTDREKLWCTYTPDGRMLTTATNPLTHALRGEILAGNKAVDLTVYLPSGRVVNTSVSAAPVSNANGMISGAVLVYRDITERQQLLEQVQASDRQKDEFLGVAAHELRTPLTSIKLNLQLVQRHSQLLNLTHRPEFTRLKFLLERSIANVNRLEGLVNDLLDVTRIQAGKLEMRLKPTDLVQILADVIGDIREQTPDRSITTMVPHHPVVLTIDGERIGQVLLNYLSNAIKYAPGKAPVTVRMEKANGVVRVAVEDKGPGLSAEQQLQVFDRFYRVSGRESAKGSVMGLGLGLYICRSIIEQHGGKVGVESSPGEGATFWFTLPEQ